jgi:hypothetical protein
MYRFHHMYSTSYVATTLDFELGRPSTNTTLHTHTHITHIANKNCEAGRSNEVACPAIDNATLTSIYRSTKNTSYIIVYTITYVPLSPPLAVC